MNRIKQTIENRKQTIRSNDFEQCHGKKKQHSNETKTNLENCEKVTKTIKHIEKHRKL